MNWKSSRATIRLYLRDEIIPALADLHGHDQGDESLRFGLAHDILEPIHSDSPWWPNSKNTRRRWLYDFTRFEISPILFDRISGMSEAAGRDPMDVFNAGKTYRPPVSRETRIAPDTRWAGFRRREVNAIRIFYGLEFQFFERIFVAGLVRAEVLKPRELCDMLGIRDLILKRVRHGANAPSPYEMLKIERVLSYYGIHGGDLLPVEAWAARYASLTREIEGIPASQAGHKIALERRGRIHTAYTVELEKKWRGKLESVLTRLGVEGNVEE